MNLKNIFYSQNSIDEFASNVKKTEDQINILINNAGVAGDLWTRLAP
jgi:short-subunit dehydrogenase involved in D-alanine esterification of teichoic acids